MDEWFKDWFNTEEYLAVYRHRNETEAKVLVELILRHVDIPDGGKVIDLACGAGRHSILFGEKGYHVTAVDLSINLLRVAKTASEKSGKKIKFVNSDLRSCPVCSKYHLAVNLFTSFGYFKDDKENFALLRDAYSSLYENGYFVIDYFNKNHLEKNLIPFSEDRNNGTAIIQRRRFEGNRVKKDIIINKSGVEKRYIESVRMYSKDELLSAVCAAGFRVCHLLGDFNGSKFDLQTSPRIIIIAQK